MKLTDDQQKAIVALEGDVFVAAGAGSGKTGVLTRRYVHAIASGYATIDEILTITFTRKAAAEMMDRIRDLLHRREDLAGKGSAASRQLMADAYRGIERARISTIDSFCSALLRANALAAGIDPDFAAIDETEADNIREEVFEECVKSLVQQHEEAVDFIAAYDPNQSGKLFDIVMHAYDDVRGRGTDVTLPHPRVPSIDEAQIGLRAVVEPALRAVSAITSPGANQQNGIDKLRRLAAALEASELEVKAALTDMAPIKAGAMGLAKQAFSLLEDARVEFRTRILSLIGARHLDFFRQLLVDFHDRYLARKSSLGVLDFTDLANKTRDLLRDNKDVGDALAASFRLIMVDEFQDTNPLQDEIIGLLARDNLFVVGDENQAIYGWRDADVTLFQQRKARAAKQDAVIELRENFRSQPEILRFVDFLFDNEGMLRPGYMKLEPSAQPAEPEDARVDMIVVDTGARGSESYVKADVYRAAEAGTIAAHIKWLLARGYKQGDIAILFRGRQGADVYRRALDAAGIDNYFAISTGFYSRLELGDINSILKLIINPLDDVALIAALRSPMFALGDDALFWLRQAGRGPIWKLLHSQEIESLSGGDRAKVRQFVDRVNSLRRLAGRVSLQALCRQILEHADYAATMAAGKWGKQKLANLKKVLMMAAEFEEEWGNDVAGFSAFLGHHKERKTRENEAPTEAEGVDAVRVMTMHAAKGLEFPVVILPRLEATGRTDDDVILLDRMGRRIGLKVCTSTGISGAAFDYDQLQQEKRARASSEDKRLGYVAMTRAMDHLVLSGSADASGSPSGTPKIREPALDWLRRALPAGWDRGEPVEELEAIEVERCPRILIRRCTNPVEMLQGREETRVPRSTAAAIEINPTVTKMPAPGIFVPQVISPTSLDLYQGCPRRYFFARELHVGDTIPGSGGTQGGRNGTQSGRNGGVLSVTAQGTLVHSLLETDLPVPGREPVAAALVEERARRLNLSDNPLMPEDLERVSDLINRLPRAQVAATLFEAERNGELKKELEFRTLVGSTIIQGQIDALAVDGENTIVVDYKTGAVGDGRSPAEAAAAYEYQMSAYALAASRMASGPVRVVIVFLGSDDPVEIVTRYDPADIAAAEERLSSLIARMGSGCFPALEEYDEHICPVCEGGVNGVRLCDRSWARNCRAG